MSPALTVTVCQCWVCPLLSFTSISDIREPQHGYKTSLWAELWLSNIDPTIQNVEWRKKFFKTSNKSKKSIMYKSQQSRADKEKGTRGSGFKFSCLKCLRRNSLEEAIYFRRHSDSGSALLHTGMTCKLQVPQKGGSTRPGTDLA